MQLPWHIEAHARAVSGRPGATLIEAALVYPVLLLLLLGLVVAGLGVFRYQQVAGLAREGARYASVRGATYQISTGETAATPQDVYNNVLRPRAIALDLKQLSYSVTWDPDNRQGSLVKVMVTYRWVPEVFLGGMDLTSTAVMPVSY